MISYPPVLHLPPKFHAESTDYCVLVVRAFLPRCLIVWLVLCLYNPRTVEMGLQVLYPFVEADKAEDLKAEYALCIYLL